MADTYLHVELVAADRVVWSGEATMVIARTVDGDVGILANHAPMLAVLVEGTVEVRTHEDEYWVAVVDAGFLSVANNRVSILSEHAQMSHEIDLEKAKHDLERAHTAGEEDGRPPGGVRAGPGEDPRGREGIIGDVMPWWEAVLDSLGVVAVLGVFGFVFLFVRRRLLGRAGGTFECSVRIAHPQERRRRRAAGPSASAATPTSISSGSACSRSRRDPSASSAAR